MIYKMITPSEPPIGTVVRAENGFTYCRTEQGWESSGGTPFTWAEMLENDNELEDVTPIRTWELPEQPPVGTVVKDREGDVWTLGENGWTARGGNPVDWHHVLRYVPLTEVRD